MQTTVYQLASRVDPGGPMQRRRRYRMEQLNNNTGRPSMRFEAHLRSEYQKAIQPDRMPPEVDPKTERHESPEQPPTASSRTMRTAYRDGFMQAFRYLQSSHRGAHQSQIGWVMSRLSRSLADNPFMGKQDIESLVDSLVARMPEYEPEA